jgi:hypothetical protein
LRTEAAQRELEYRQRALDSEWGRVQSELEGIQEGWLRLQRELPAEGEGPVDAAALQERLARLEALWGDLLREESELSRERSLVERLWRWMLGVWMPSVDESLLDPAAREAFGGVRRRMLDLDRRWQASLCDLKRVLTEEESARWRGRLDEAQGRALSLSRELLAYRAGREPEGSAALASLQASLEDARRDLAASEAEKGELENRLKTLSDKILSLERAAAQARGLRAEAETLRREAEDARREEAARASALERAAAGERSSLEARLCEASRLCGQWESKARAAELGLQEAVRRLEALRESAGRSEDIRSENAALRRAQDSLSLSLRNQTEELESARALGLAREREIQERSASSVVRLENALFQRTREKAALAAESQALRAERDEARRRLGDAEREALAKAAQALSAEPAEETTPAVSTAPGPALAQAPPLPPDIFESIGPAQTAPAEEPEDAGPIPSVEPVLDPAWSRIVGMLRTTLSNAFAHLRRLAAARLPEGHKALLKLTAGELAKAQDDLRVLDDYLGDDLGDPLCGRVETALDSALNAWSAAFVRRGILVSRKFQPCPKALFSPEALRIAFYQVLRNAYEAMPRGGSLAVETLTDPDGWARAEFSDSGPGFSPEASAFAFKPFCPCKPGHLGLGLAFVRRALTRFGGEASAENGPSRGAVVSLRLPPAGEPPLPTAPAE